MQRRLELNTERTFENYIDEALQGFRELVIRLTASDVNRVNSLPTELMIKIICELAKPEELINLMFVSKQFSQLVKKNVFWQSTEFKTHDQYLTVNKLNQVAMTKEERTVLAYQANRELTKDQSNLKILMIGKGEAGKKLELAAKHLDPMGYAYDGGAVINDHLRDRIRLCSILSKEGQNELEYVERFYLRDFLPSGKQGGAQVAFISVDLYNDGWKRSLVHAVENSFLDGKLIFLLVDSNNYRKNVAYKDSEYARYLSSSFPEIHKKVAGILDVEENYSNALCNSVINQMTNVIQQLAFAAETTPYLSNLATELQTEIVSRLDNETSQSMLLVSKGFFSAVKADTPPSDKIEENNEPPKENCSIM